MIGIAGVKAWQNGKAVVKAGFFDFRHYLTVKTSFVAKRISEKIGFLRLPNLLFQFLFRKFCQTPVVLAVSAQTVASGNNYPHPVLKMIVDEKNRADFMFFKNRQNVFKPRIKTIVKSD